MLLDDRRLVLALEAICWCTAAMVFMEQTDLPRALASLPAMIAMLIRVEYPPPGRGVGTPAEALTPGVRFEDERHSAVLGKKGELLRDHAYVLTFLRKNKQCLQVMPRIHRLAGGCDKMRSTVHFVALTPLDDEVVTVSRKAKGMPKGKDAVQAVLPAVDTTGDAWLGYINKHSCWALPHVFVVDRKGTIIWHGQANRRGLVPAIKTIVKQVDEKTMIGRKGD